MDIFMFPQVKTQLSLSLSQKNFLVIAFHLTVALLWKTGISKKDSPYCSAGECQIPGRGTERAAGWQ